MSWLWLVGLIALVACGETTGFGTGGGGGEGGASDETVSHVLRVFELEGEAPIEGARVCELDTENCVRSNADGIAVIEFPSNREIAFTVEKEGYGAWIYANVTDENFQVEGTAEMVPAEALADIAESLGTTFPWPRGMVGLVRWPSLTGVKFVPIGPAIDAVGQPFYFDAETQEYTRELEATTSWPVSATFPLAQGGFTDVTPGVWEFEMAGRAGDCAIASWAWPGDAPNRIRIPVRAGYVTYGSMLCEDSP